MRSGVLDPVDDKTVMQQLTQLGRKTIEFVKNGVLGTLAFIVPVIAGVVVLTLMVTSRRRSVQAPLEERATPVRVIWVPSVDVVPRARAYGVVQPGRTWDAVVLASTFLVLVAVPVLFTILADLEP